MNVPTVPGNSVPSKYCDMLELSTVFTTKFVTHQEILLLIYLAQCVQTVTCS